MPQARAGGAQTAKSRNAYFDAHAGFWEDVYDSRDVHGQVYRRRLGVALAWIDRLSLDPDSCVVDVGCGPGLAAIELARRGFRVAAVDSAPEMIERARVHARAAGVERRIGFGVGPAEQLELADGAADVVVALGLVPWLDDPPQALRELARVAGPGARLIASADNATRLDYLLDPRLNTRLAPLRQTIKRALRIGTASGGVRSRLHSRREFDALLAAAGFDLERGAMLGYGPFTLLGRQVVPDELGRALDRRLQRAAATAPAIAARADQYLVLARRRPPAAGGEAHERPAT